MNHNEEGDNVKESKGKQKHCFHHQTQRPNWFCIDQNCKEKIRFACGDCVLDYPHYQHQHKRLIEYEGIVRSRCSERMAKLRELQQISEVKNSVADLFKNIREDFNYKINNLEKSIEKQIRMIEHNFSNRQLSEFSQKVKTLQNKLLFCKFLFCDDDISDLSLTLYNQSQYLESNIEKEKIKREFICNQFKDHFSNIKETYDKFSNSLQSFTQNFQASSKNAFNLEHFTQKVEKVDQNKPQHSLAIHKVITLTNNRLMTFSDDATMQIFNQSLQVINSIKHDSKINHADILNEHQIVISSTDQKISVYNIEKNELVKKFIGHTEPILALRAIDSNKFASGGIDGNLFVWSLDQDQPYLKQQNVHEGFIYCIEAYGVNKFATSGGDDGKIKLWEDFKVIQALNAHESKVQNLQYLENINMLVSADDHGIINVWNLADFSLLSQLTQEYEEPLVDIIQLSNNLFCTLGVEQVLKIFKIDLDQGEINNGNQVHNNSTDLSDIAQSKSNKNITTVMSLSTYQNINTITKFEDEMIIGGCQDGHIVIIR